MAHTIINEHFACLPESYLFSEVAAKVREFKTDNPEADIISLGIGDVTIPIAPVVSQAMHEAIEELSAAESFKGYGPEQGYMFLREAVAEYDYRKRGIDICEDEIFISDGAKSDLGNISDLFSTSCRVAVTDPVYPVYVDSNVMAGRAGKWLEGRWSGIEYLPCTEQNGFVPPFPKERVDLIYLCYPNNPTGTVMSFAELQGWVEYARSTGAIILYDSAYEAYIRTPGVPASIYEIPGAEEVAIEFRSYSKRAGFTGIRCGYTVVPKALVVKEMHGNIHSLNKLWKRRQCTKFNGASYVSQRGAAATYTPEGQQYTRAAVDTYMSNAHILRQACCNAGLAVYGGVDAPYIWVKTPDTLNSWEFFHLMLHKLHLVCTPGSGFGPGGEGYVRLTAFNTPKATRQAADRIMRFDFNQFQSNQNL